MKTEIIKRVKLYEKVWSMPMLHLAKEYSMSGRGLARLYARHNIPRPPRGYWAKLSNGVDAKKTSLPNPEENPTISIFCKPSPNTLASMEESSQINEAQGLTKQSTNFSVCGIPRELIDHLEHEETRLFLTKELEEECKRDPIQLSKTLKDCHPFISEMNKKHKEERKEHKKSYGSYYRFSPGQYCGLRVDSQLRRGKLILNTLLKAFEERGYQPIEGGAREQEVRVHGHIITFKIQENCNKKLRFELLGWSYYSQRTWWDANVQRLEDCLDEIMRAFIIRAAMLKNRQITKDLEQEKKDDDKARIQDLESKVHNLRSRQQAEDDRLDQLKQEMHDWETAEKLRNYVSFKQAHLKKQGLLTVDAQKDLDWDRQQIQHMDPLISTGPTPNDLLDDEIAELSQQITKLKKPYYVFGLYTL
jgi:hypothetical protein